MTGTLRKSLLFTVATIKQWKYLPSMVQVHLRQKQPYSLVAHKVPRGGYLTAYTLTMLQTLSETTKTSIQTLLLVQEVAAVR